MPVQPHPTDGTSETLSVFYDFSDPLSYVISTQVEGWCRDTHFDIRWMPLENSEKTNVSGQSESRHALASFFAETFGYPLFQRQELDSGPALRASVLAQEKGSVAQFTMRVFQFWYATDLPPYADILLDGLASDCSISPSDLRTALGNDNHWTQETLSKVTLQAHEFGIKAPAVLLAPNGEKIDFSTLNPQNAIDELNQQLSAWGLSSDTTSPSRCYLPTDSQEPERFCQWCTCGKKPS